jgi:ribosomal protein S18 acetylase RimI-like enzyme
VTRYAHPVIDLERSGFVVRPARPADIEALLAFWATSAKGHSVSDDVAGVTALLDRDPDAVLLAVEPDTGQGDGAIIGCVIAGWDGWRARLYRLSVSPSHRRRGIARTLIDAGEARLLSLGARRYEAMVLDDNEPGRAAWSAAGYHRDAGWSRWLKYPS